MAGHVKFDVTVVCEHGTAEIADEEITGYDYFINAVAVSPDEGWKAAKFVCTSDGNRCYKGTKERHLENNFWQGSSYSERHMSWCGDDDDAYCHIVITVEFEQITPPPPTEDSAIRLSLVSDPAGVGDLTGGGVKSGAVGSSVQFDVSAAVRTASRGTYAFSHWIDDDGLRRDAAAFAKAFTLKSGYTVSNPEQKTFTAHFRRCTGLILRSAASGLILRGKANRILRDE